MKLLLTLLVATCFSCTNRSYDIKGLEEQFNSWVGKVAPERTKNPVYWKTIKSTAEETELEQNRPDGCSHAILLEKNTRIVKSWRYTSDKSKCDKTVYVPNV